MHLSHNTTLLHIILSKHSHGTSMKCDCEWLTLLQRLIIKNQINKQFKITLLKNAQQFTHAKNSYD